MNRWAEIQDVARGIAESLTPDPQQAQVLSEDLVNLVVLVTCALTGKTVLNADTGGRRCECLPVRDVLNGVMVHFAPCKDAAAE